MPTFISLHFKLTLETPFATMAMARSGSARRRTTCEASGEVLAVAPRTDLDTGAPRSAVALTNVSSTFIASKTSLSSAMNSSARPGLSGMSTSRGKVGPSFSL